MMKIQYIEGSYGGLDHVSQEINGRKALILENHGEATCEQCGERKDETWSIEADMHGVPVCLDCIESYGYTDEVADVPTPEELAEGLVQQTRDYYVGDVEVERFGNIVRIDVKNEEKGVHWMDGFVEMAGLTAHNLPIEDDVEYLSDVEIVKIEFTEDH